VTEVVWETPPVLPVIVIVRLPVWALLPAETVMTEVPAPVIELGLNATVTCGPCPEADKAIVELKPPVAVVVIVKVPELPLKMVREPGDALIEKPGEGAATVRETIVVWAVPLADVPVTVMRYLPGAVLEGTVIVMVEVPAPALIGFGLKVTATPEGCPDAVKVTAELNPPLTALVIVELPEPPCATVTEAGDAERLKPDVGGVVRALINPAFGLPHPVTRS
jgi:hypothetical protein